MDRKVVRMHPKELVNWKARIGERRVERYIKDSLILSLKESGWDDVLFTPAWAKFNFTHFKNGTFLPERMFFIANGLFPTRNFLEKFERLTKLLENVPDGFLVKLKKTGRFKRLGNALVELGLESRSWDWYGHKFDCSEHEKNERLLIVDGDIEIIEVKTDKSNVPRHQIASYTRVVEKGYSLRFFHVNIISFEKNLFEVKEKLVTNPSEIKSRIIFN